MSNFPKKTAILVGGGPAPGINTVIGAATIRSILSGAEVIGLRDGFKWIIVITSYSIHYTKLYDQRIFRKWFCSSVRNGQVLSQVKIYASTAA